MKMIYSIENNAILREYTTRRIELNYNNNYIQENKNLMKKSIFLRV